MQKLFCMLKKVNYFREIPFKIDISFYVVALICIFFKVFNMFFYFFIFVLLHEIAHILVGKLFGLKCKKIVITPIGQFAILDKLETIDRNKKMLIVSAGVLLNLFFAFLFSFFTNEKMQLIRNINLLIAFFNILPIYPLDGGRFLQYFLGSKIGDLKAGNIIRKISKILSLVLFILGFFQFMLFPYNLSLLCLGIYFIKVNKREYINFTFEFYKYLTQKKNYEQNRIMRVKEILVSKDILNKDIFLNLGQDYSTFINICENGEIISRIWEKDFILYIERNGLNGKIFDMVKNKTVNGL